IWTISGRCAASSAPTASSTFRTALALRRSTASVASRARRLIEALISPGRSPRADVVDHAREDLVELHLRLVADEGADLRDVRHAARHVLEAGLVRLIVRDGHDLRAAAGHRLDLLGQRAHRDLLAVADVEHLADGLRLLHQPHEAVHDVADVGEAAPLRAVAEH